ncbi:transmembrane protein 120B [Trichuris trichiura]|uniref:Transmembrane protein 120B n=1 Tax=Trichuris trichiura TaxID=36087 RepID=A0A077ZBJ8_TRITR|nr:transmembrane protein 120B [Trichuris trichiura]
MDLKLDPATAREAVESFCQRFQSFQVEYDDYIERLSQVTKYQPTGRKMVAHQRHELKELVETIKAFSEGLLTIIYLDIILGQINVSILNKLQRFRYKDDYEKFKLRVTIILFIFAPFVCYFHQRSYPFNVREIVLYDDENFFRVLDAAYNFFLVWYYCTLTIRESILRCNGSRIKGWWLFHHYASAVLSGILLTWPDGECYQKSRLQLLLLSCYISFVQILQCNYQRGCLYRLRALGRRYSMDITVEGFHSWMFRGLTFLLPFLIFGYLYQLYIAYKLYLISKEVWCPEWQVTALALIFFGVAVGNTLTTAQVCLQKVQRKEESKRLQKKYHSIMQAERPRGSKDE